MMEFRKFPSFFFFVIFSVALGGCDNDNNKLNELQIANEMLAIKYEKDIAELNEKHRIELKKLQIANEILVIEHEKDVAELIKKHLTEKILIKSKARAKSKIQRGVSAIPVIGLASLAIFEKMEFDDWKNDHPNGTSEEYAHELYETSQELFKKEYHDFEKYADQMSKTIQQLFDK